jgi:hypothetical protein
VSGRKAGEIVTALLRRLAVPLVGASLVVIVLVVAFVVFDFGGTAGDGGSDIPIIELGGESTGQGLSAGQHQGGSGGTGSTVQAGTTVVTDEIRVEPGPQFRGGSSSTGQGR